MAQALLWVGIITEMGGLFKITAPQLPIEGCLNFVTQPTHQLNQLPPRTKTAQGRRNKIHIEDKAKGKMNGVKAP